ncbi:hypothetical protein EBR66_05265 [bacterium]|nr:hypothetical protein [bacterium]
MRMRVLGVVAALFLCSSSIAAALSLEDVGAQIQQMLAQVSNIKKQMTAAADAASSIDSVGSTPPPLPREAWCNLNQRLAFGMQGDQVSLLQQFLKNERFYDFEITGYFGPRTEKAVRMFQAREGIIPAVSDVSGGEVGPLTLTRIKKDCGGDPLPNLNMFSATPLLGKAPLTVTFTAKGTPSIEQTIALADLGKRAIDFGDGTNQILQCSTGVGTTCTVTVNHTYSANGVFTAYLANVGYYGIQNDSVFGTRSNIASLTITVSDETESAKFSAKPTSGHAPLTVTFTADGFRKSWIDKTTGQLVSYLDRERYIDFGDGVVQKLKCPKGVGKVCTTTLTHEYDTEGTYTAYLVDASNITPLPAGTSMQPAANRTNLASTIITVTEKWDGFEAHTSMTVEVGSGGTTTCDEKSPPVCGAKYFCGSSLGATCNSRSKPTTYKNSCAMKADGATLLYQGICYEGWGYDGPSNDGPDRAVY